MTPCNHTHRILNIVATHNEQSGGQSIRPANIIRSFPATDRTNVMHEIYNLIDQGHLERDGQPDSQGLYITHTGGDLLHAHRPHDHTNALAVHDVERTT